MGVRAALEALESSRGARREAEYLAAFEASGHVDGPIERKTT
jgi:hypothetical protein